MKEMITISAKNLGGVAIPDFCPKCFYIKMLLANRLPYQIFPGIFSTIDAYTKKHVHAYFDEYGCEPPWLSELGTFTGYVDPPGFRDFKYLDEKQNILLRGEADGILKMKGGEIAIVDYKTARHKGDRDPLIDIYKTQLNVYAKIAEYHGMGQVKTLALIYEEPQTTLEAAADESSRHEDGLTMSFNTKIHEIPIELDKIDPLLARVREIVDLPTCPPGREGCRDCKLSEDFVDAYTGNVKITGSIATDLENIARAEMFKSIGCAGVIQVKGSIISDELLRFLERFFM